MNLKLLLTIIMIAFSFAAIGGQSSKPNLLTWYTDGAFEPFVVRKPVVNQAEWGRILSRSWDEYGPAEMSNHTAVNSCDQAFAAIKAGVHAAGSANDIDIYKNRLIACIAARVIFHGEPAKTSYLRNFKMDSAEVRNVPAALTLVISNSQTAKVTRAIKLGKTLGDVLPKDATFTVRHNPRGNAPMVRVHDGTGGIEDMSLLARGDFNHDGIEDLLIAVSSSVVGGTYTQNDLYLITRLGPHKPMKVLAAYPDLGLGIPVFH